MSLESIKENIRDRFMNVALGKVFQFIFSPPTHPWTLGGLNTKIAAAKGDEEARIRLATGRDDFNEPLGRGPRAIERVCTLAPLFLAAANGISGNIGGAINDLLILAPVAKALPFIMLSELQWSAERMEEWAWERDFFKNNPKPVVPAG